MKRLKKSQENNPLYKSKKITRKEKRQQKKGKKADVKPNVNALPTEKKPAPKADPELPSFSGAVAEKGAQFKARPRWQLKEESVTHSKLANEQKKDRKRQREETTIRKEKREIERPKKGKGKPEVDSSLVNKYLKMLHSKSNDNGPKPAKRSKWYDG